MKHKNIVQTLGHNLHKHWRLNIREIREMSCMLSFQLDSLPSKELDKDVLVSLVHGSELTLNYFELKNENVNIPFHEHPVEHLVVVLKGEMEFLFEDKNLIVKKKDCLFVPAKIRHTARVIEGPVKALEIYPIVEDEYYNR
jgi:quercetin dioxygenase-like cupin family protein